MSRINEDENVNISQNVKKDFELGDKEIKNNTACAQRLDEGLWDSTNC